MYLIVIYYNFYISDLLYVRPCLTDILAGPQRARGDGAAARRGVAGAAPAAAARVRGAAGAGAGRVRAGRRQGARRRARLQAAQAAPAH